ncbi:hypothetical protein ACKWTF_014183 [Chironomus riparius]
MKIAVSLALIFSTSIAINPQLNSLSNFVCKVAMDVLISQNHTQDVLIGYLGGKSKSTVLNDVISCISHEYSVVVTDLKSPMTDKGLKKASIMIFELYEFRIVSSNYFLKQCCSNCVPRHTGGPDKFF